MHASLLINKYLLTNQWTAAFFWGVQKIGFAVNLSGCVLYFPSSSHWPWCWYGNPAVIHSAYALPVAVHECRCVCLEALEVHPRNICQGSSVITSAKSGGQWDSSTEKDQWRSIRGREAIKRDGKRGDCGRRHREEDARKHSLLVLTPLTELLARVQWICLIRAWSIYHSVPDASLPSTTQLCRHWSALQRVNTQVKEILACKWIWLFLACRAKSMIKGGVVSLPTVISGQRSTSLT